MDRNFIGTLRMSSELIKAVTTTFKVLAIIEALIVRYSTECVVENTNTIKTTYVEHTKLQVHVLERGPTTDSSRNYRL